MAEEFLDDMAPADFSDLIQSLCTRNDKSRVPEDFVLKIKKNKKSYLMDSRISRYSQKAFVK